MRFVSNDLFLLSPTQKNRAGCFWRCFSIPAFLLLLLCGFAYTMEIPSAEEIKLMCSSAPGKDKYPDAKAVVIRSEAEITIDSLGNYRWENFAIVKFLTFGGMRNYENYRIYYNSGIWDIKVLPSFSVGASGTMDTLVENEINFVKPDYITESGSSYSNSKMVVLSFPSLSESSAIVFHYELRTNEPPDRPLDWNLPVAGEDPVLHYKLTIRHPKDITIRYKTLNGAPEPSVSPSELVFIADSVSGFVDEPLSVPLAEFRPTIRFTATSSWNEISKFIGDKFFPYIKPVSAQIRKKAEELGNDPKRIFLFVADSVRNIDIDFRDERIVPLYPDTVVRNGYGDPLQKSILLGSLLVSCGYSVFPLLLPYPEMDIVKDIPLFSQFRSVAIMAVKGNDTLYFDPMAHTAPVGIIPEYSGKHIFVVKETGGEFVELPRYLNKLQLDYKIQMLPSGGVNGELALGVSGTIERNLREYFKGEKPRRIRMKCGEVANQIGPGVKLKDYSLSRVEDLLEPVKFSITFNADSFAFIEKYMMIVNLPEPSLPFAELLPPLTLDERRVPMNLGEPFEIICTFEITPPEEYEIIFSPEKQSFANQFGSYSVSSEDIAGVSKITYHISTNASKITPEKYPEILKLFRGFNAPKNWVVLLKKRV